MKRQITAFTILETLIGVALLAVIVGSLLGIFVMVKQYFEDGIAMANSQATARMVIEKIVRPYVREGKDFSVINNGDGLEVTNYESTILNPIIDTFTYVDEDNKLEKNDNVIGLNIVKIPGMNIFQEVEEDERVRIYFAVRNEGIYGGDKEVRISTEIQLRN